MRVACLELAWLDDAWERDVAISTGYRLPIYGIAITVGVVAMVLAWRIEERWAIDAAVEQMNWRLMHD